MILCEESVRFSGLDHFCLYKFPYRATQSILSLHEASRVRKRYEKCYKYFALPSLVHCRVFFLKKNSWLNHFIVFFLFLVQLLCFVKVKGGIYERFSWVTKKAVDSTVLFLLCLPLLCVVKITISSSTCKKSWNCLMSHHESRFLQRGLFLRHRTIVFIPRTHRHCHLTQ